MESGAVLAGRYRLDRRLGRGGMGEVWGGRDLRLNRDVAVKVLRETDPDEAEVRRFVREATVAAGLQHPGITVVFDADAHDGQLFIVTERLSGQDLGKVLSAHPRGLPLDQVQDFGIQLTDALAAAHGRGIIHRDLKPANLFVQTEGRLPNGRLKVCDFGLARDLMSSSKVTAPGEVFGTPAYMAPEQWRTAATSSSADLYAVGCILYEMLTGRVPFEGPSLPVLMTQHLTQPPVPPRDLKPGTPATLNDLVLSLLSKETSGRPASAAEVLASLTRLRDAPRHSPSPPRTPEPVPAGLAGLPQTPPQDPKPGRPQTATLTTSQGTITIALLPDHAPKTVSNFVKLAEEKFYDGTIFHRVVPKFVIQGGDPEGTGRGGPGYTFDDEIHPDLTFSKKYQLAMANAGTRNGRGTNGSQFFITVSKLDYLTGKHTIFGDVISGQDVVEAIARTPTGRGDRPITDVVLQSVTIARG